MLGFRTSDFECERESKMPGPKRYDLEDRTLAFAHTVRAFIKTLPRTLSNLEDLRQLTRASGSVGANYIEANESLSRRDFVMRINTVKLGDVANNRNNRRLFRLFATSHFSP